ncbi:MAG: glycosyltransferase, partial [Betaproteobacteria bacterium]|nr:glycosyltransferase [Betaproteobacteria bacterium]
MTQGLLTAPLVSVVIPIYNEVETLPKLVAAVGDALLREPSLGFELIIVDDGSKDGSRGL